MERFPGTTRSAIGAAINGKLTELRQKAKKVLPAAADDGGDDEH
jgi:hypothetical protein